MSCVALIGAGSWGTATAIHIAKAGHRVLLWGRDADQLARMQKTRCNSDYLPNIPFPESLEVCVSLRECLQAADYVILAVPSNAFAAILAKIDKPKLGLAWLTKGIDPKTHQLLSNLVTASFGANYPMALISGPSFAKEVAEGLPTALTIASNDATFQKGLHQLFHHQALRAYLSHDLIGVQLCGAVKNVLAIACGVSDGLGFGANAKAALITRGNNEMTRLGLALGGMQETFAGLAGLGDLVLTCTDDQSRNRRFGLYLGQGMSLSKAEEKVGQVVEGKHNAAQIQALAAQYKVDMPICSQVNALLQDKVTALEVVQHLMSRPAKNEW